ncbi:type I secretion protein TolC [Sphingomonas populi]|uniref:Type I secretion protein TolC n=1 Tax=Sphingomonas populi TaxID=2484750 RepID=A0A4Q6XTH3_9SPHN|nr:TolC family outer membrane protein [Sphingomonas populi]RZF60882.1 type I secretion protein TolC [Sphingomonas populi]
MTRKTIAAIAALCLSGAASAETLRDAVVAAYSTNPQLAAAQARQEALAESPEQARGAGRLTAEADGAGGYSRFDYGKGGSGSVTASLPVWTGGRVSSAVRAASGDVAAGAEGVRDTQAAVLETVVGAYADLLYAQQAVAVTHADIELLDNQVAEARSRFGLGLATRTDVAQLEAQRESAVSTLADAEGSAAAIAATYRATVGHSPGTLDPNPTAPVTLPASIDSARSRAIESNPIVRQQKLAAGADAARIDQQRAERNPYVGLGGTYGLAAGEGRSGYANAAVGGVTLRVPLLTGGLISSRVRQAEATYRADRFTIDAAQRDAARLAETAWANLAAAQARVNANARRVEAAELALKGVRAEYAFSLRTTVDILIADESLRAAQLALARSRSDVLIGQAALLGSIGQLGRDSYGI